MQLWNKYANVKQFLKLVWRPPNDIMVAKKHFCGRILGMGNRETLPTFISHIIHVWHIYVHLVDLYWTNVSKYTSPMDPIWVCWLQLSQRHCHVFVAIKKSNSTESIRSGWNMFVQIVIYIILLPYYLLARWYFETCFFFWETFSTLGKWSHFTKGRISWEVATRKSRKNT